MTLPIYGHLIQHTPTSRVQLMLRGYAGCTEGYPCLYISPRVDQSNVLSYGLCSCYCFFLFFWTDPTSLIRSLTLKYIYRGVAPPVLPTIKITTLLVCSYFRFLVIFITMSSTDSLSDPEEYQKIFHWAETQKDGTIPSFNTRRNDPYEVCCPIMISTMFTH